MANSIEEVFYKHLLNDPDMKDAFTNIYYIENDYESGEPYATTYLMDDPEKRSFLCPANQGVATFACDNFARTAPKGINDRVIYKSVVKKLEAMKIEGFDIWRVEITGSNDRPNTINGLMQFSFNVEIYWNS